MALFSAWNTPVSAIQCPRKGHARGSGWEREVVKRLAIMGSIQAEFVLWCQAKDTEESDDGVVVGEGGQFSGRAE